MVPPSSQPWFGDGHPWSARSQLGWAKGSPMVTWEATSGHVNHARPLDPPRPTLRAGHEPARTRCSQVAASAKSAALVPTRSDEPWLSARG
jgi:hypothetical protein